MNSNNLHLTLESEVLSDLIQKTNETEYLIAEIKNSGFNSAFLSVPSNKEIFNAIISTYKHKKPITLVSVKEELKNPKLEQLLTQIYKSPVNLSVADFTKHLKALKENYQRYSLANINKQIAYKLEKGEINPIESVNLFENEINDIRKQNTQKHGLNGIEAIKNWERKISRGKDDLLPTGFGKLDWILNGGIDKGNVILLAANSGYGKSSMSLDILYHTCIKNNK